MDRRADFRSLRIGFVAEPTTGGVDRYVRSVSAAMAAAGHAVTVFSPDDSRPIPGVEQVVVPITRMPSGRDIESGRLLRAATKDFQVVHAHAFKAGVVSRMAIRPDAAHGPKMLFSPHAWGWYEPGAAGNIARASERALSGRLDGYVLISAGELWEYRTQPWAKKPAWLVPTASVASRPANYDAILCHGRLCRQKGQDLLLDAYQFLAAHRPDVPDLHFVGNGPLERTLQRRAQRLGLTRRVHFHGWQEELPGHLRANALVVVPSRWDGQSLALMEAIDRGETVVASTVDGTHELAETIAVTPDSVPSLIAGISAALDGCSGRHVARGEVDYSDVADRLLSVYDLALDDTPRTLTIEPALSVPMAS